MNQEEYRKLLGRMQATCSRSEKCLSDIRKKLEGQEVSPPEAEKILGDLVKESFIDEHRYARAYVNDKCRLQGWGPVKIGNMLKIKGIQEDIIRDALSRADHGLFLKKLKESLLRKNSAIKDQDPRIRYARLVRFGLGKGYTYSQIQKALERL